MSQRFPSENPQTNVGTKQAAIALCENAAYLQQAIEYAPVGMVMFDREMRYLSVSRRWLEDYQLSDDIIGHSHYEIFADISPQWKQIHQECLAGGIAQRSEDPYPRADGSIAWVSWSIRPWYTASGEIGGIMMFSENITQRKQTELELQEREEQFRLTFEQAAIGICHVSLDGRWLLVNQRLCEIVGYEREELLSLTFQDITHPDDLETDLDYVQQLLKGIIPRYSMEKRYIHKNGSIIWISLDVSLLRQASGEPVYFISTIQDIGDRKQAQIALQQSEERYRSLIAATSQIVWTADAEGRSPDIPSMRAYTGQTESEVIDLGWLDAIHPEDRGKTTQTWMQAVQTKSLYEVEYRIRGVDGSYRYFQGRGVPILNADGNIREWVGTCTDIQEQQVALHERKQAEQALQESNTLLRSILESTPDFIVVKDLEGRHVALNSNLAKFFGQPIEEIIGKNDLEILPPEVAQEIIAKDRQIVTTGITESYEEDVFNGEIKETFLTTKAPWRDAQNNILGIIAIMRNISDRKQAELALQQSEERYRSLIEASSQIVWASPADGIPIDDNPAWRELTGQTWEEFKIWGWLKVIHPSDRQFMVETTQTAVKTGTPYQAEFRVRRHDGEYRYMLTRGVPLLAADGSVREWIGTCSDIHDRKQAELALQQSEERYRSLIEASSQIVWIVPPDGIVSLDIPSWREFTGQRFEEVVGWAWLDAIHPDDRPLTAEAWETAVKNGSLYQVEHRLQRYDGEYRHMTARGVPVLAADGSIREWVGTHTDITERKLAEQSLRQTLEILDSASDSIIIRDMDDRIAYWNRGAGILYGWKKEEVIGKYIHTFLQTVFPKPLEIILSEFLEQGHWEGELHHITRDGQHIIVASRWTLQRDAAGKPCAQLEINNDITERKQFEIALAKAKEAAEAASFAKSEFLANMSHELRTPLNGILGYAQILQRSKHLHEEARSRIDVIYQCGSHLLTLINDILDLSKIEAQKVELMPTDFHFPAFLQGVAEMCRIRAELKNINFQYQLASELPIGISADEKRLRQVLINLLSNAIKFTDTGSVTFTISYACEEKIRFEVRDTGIGIPQEKLQAIFQPFEQAGDSRRQTEGTGLGLAISQRIVELMGSTIHVQSEMEVGSIFWFDVNLPAADEWVKTSQADDKGQIIGIKDWRPKVLVVDDKWANRSVIANLLSPIGFEIAEALNGEEGWQKIEEFQPDLVLTDLLMPELDGFGLIKRIRASEAFKDIAIIVSSASVFETDQHRSLEVGGDEFLPKPIQAMDLFQKLRKHLHLEWVYEEQKELNQPERDNTQLVAPSKAELEVLYELVMKGNFKGITKKAALFAQMNEKYIPFANKLHQLAKGFQDQDILALIQSYK